MENEIWTSKQISEALAYRLSISNNKKFGKVQFNSHHVEKGDIFIAMKGKRDGHDFVLNAFEKGAGLAIVNKDIKGVSPDKLIKVADTFKALQNLAQYKRKNSKAYFIAITGTVGKTTTKEIVGLMLKNFKKTFVGRGNFNNQIGLLINLASMADDDEFAVLELAMNKAGEISSLSRQLLPNMAIITSVSQGHLEFLGSIKKIADAKSEIFEGLKPGGIAIINRDMSTYKRCIRNIKTIGIRRVNTFGRSEFANIRFLSYLITAPNVVKLTYSVFSKRIEFSMHLVSRHTAINFSIGLAIIHCLELDINKAVKYLLQFKTQVGRGLLLNVKKEDKKYLIIADYYNANPESVRASLKYLEDFRILKKVAVLGDMQELGKNALKMHFAIISYIIKSGIKKLFLVGELMRQLAAKLPARILVYSYKTSEELACDINDHIEGEEVILIKGSRGIFLEKVAEALGVKDVL